MFVRKDGGSFMRITDMRRIHSVTVRVSVVGRRGN